MSMMRRLRRRDDEDSEEENEECEEEDDDKEDDEEKEKDDDEENQVRKEGENIRRFGVMGFGRKQYKEAGRKEEGQLTSRKTRTALNLCLQKVCLFHYYGRVDHKAVI